MKNLRQLLALPLAFLICFATAAYASPQHIVAPSQVASTVADQAAARDADRAAVREALARPEVRSVAASMGMDLNRLEGAVSTMSDTEIAQAASTARQVNEQLVGGASTVVISTTTIIIALLVVLLIIVIAK
jgi:hypothetical protein